MYTPSLLKTASGRFLKTLQKHTCLAVFLLPLSVLHAGQSQEIRLDKLLEEARSHHPLPGISVAVVKDNVLVASGAAGLRRSYGPEKVTADDRFHIGSITKSFTSTLAALLVEEGLISWNTTVEDLFAKELEVPAGFKKVTLLQLVQHRGGVGDEMEEPYRSTLTPKMLELKGDLPTLRAEGIKLVLEMGPVIPVGTFKYSNTGYVVAGRMLEKVTGKSWEELVSERLLKPLKLDSAGFGAPATPGLVDHPWGHVDIGTPEGMPVPPESPESDNHPAFGPAGTLHMNVKDLARWGAFHAGGTYEDQALLAV